ncbi:MAG: hypothetical protein FJX74_17700 [Armatimonadetes bacterium]|nr:hypothetical protein [Armatimonadota bacterium]
MARFLADECFPLRSAERLRAHGHDVAAVSVDTPGASDEDVLSRAVDEHRVLLTLDRDYGDLVYARGSRPPVGIVYFRFDPETPTEPADRLLRVLAAGGVQLEGVLTVLSRGAIRQRRLPGGPHGRP